MIALQNQHIVCVANPLWEGDYVKSTVQLMRHLSAQSRILYVEYARTWIDVLRSLFDRSRIPLARVLGFSPRLFRPELKEQEDLHVLTPPPILPVNWLPHGKVYGYAQRLNAWLICRAIRRAMDSLNMKNPIVVNAFQPSLGIAMKGSLDEILTVYYCYDEISQSVWCSRHGSHDESRFMNMVDVVITSSDALWKAKECDASSCYVVKNGVECELFEQVLASRSDQRTDADKSVVIGFVGSIDQRLDIDLLVKVASICSEYTFQFIGPVIDDRSGARLDALENIELLGPRKPADLPDVMKNFCVGIVPFKLNENTRFVYPMKVNEYLSAALPVVMTNFADIAELRDVVSVATGADAFAQKVKNAVVSDSYKARISRQVFARRNSWTNRSRDFARILERSRRLSRAT